MFEFISRLRHLFGAAKAPKKLDAASADETVEKRTLFFDHLTDAERRELKWKRRHPKSDWRRVRDQHPNLEKAAVGEIVENVAAVYQRIDDICRTRLQLSHPKSDEVEVQMLIMLIPRPGPPMVESALVDRMHLPAEERLQEVATMMVDKVLGR